MRVGTAIRSFVSHLSLTRRQEGWRSAAVAGAKLVSQEMTRAQAQMRLRWAQRRVSTKGSRDSADGDAPRTARARKVDVGAVRSALAIFGIETIPISLRAVEFEAHRRDYRYPRAYAGGSVAQGGARESKMLEYFIALKLLDIQPSDVVIDVASELSVFPDIVRRLVRARVFRQDLIYPPGVRGEKIGGSAAEMPIENEFADALSLHNSFEHFEADADTGFIREAWRVLRPGGRVCIVPLYLSEQYEIFTDPLVKTEDVVWDQDAAVVPVAGYRNRFGRFYSPVAVLNRVVQPAQECGFEVEIFEFRNSRELEPSCGIEFGLVLRKPGSKRKVASLAGESAVGGVDPRKQRSWSIGTLLLAASLFVILASGLGQPARAVGVLACLAGAPLAITARFARNLGRVETAVVGLAAAAAVCGIVSGVTLAFDAWTPRQALLAMSVLVSAVALIDLSRDLKRRWTTGALIELSRRLALRWGAGALIDLSRDLKRRWARDER